jgi:membrane-bound metal-dependent hydrolase YbcI (DUF457 family)
MMGPSHAMSGAAAWLAGVTLYSHYTGAPLSPSVLLLGTTVAAGAALAPDLDNYSSTVVSAFGIVGKGVGRLVDAVSVLIYNVTKSSREQVKDGGHRTFFHTIVAAVLAGLLVSFLTSFTSIVHVLGQTLTWGQLWSVIIMAIFLNLGLSGLFAKQITKYRAKFGPTIIMALSVVLAVITAILLPEGKEVGSYAWLGLAVGFGWFVHLLGDAITKAGVPMFWPIRIRRKAWYDVALPSVFRITAGSPIETLALLPLFTAVTILLAGYQILVYAGVF